ncbi:glycoside hydrolase family 5 protein [Aerosakkonemataceae cyanobacterium BLCC-F154]|uniref:Glycoside hydrolase family 5 protein n=1 Tax=Floridaenema fluviatile BLCC-F154 TaxID=3153640 RepID=A0ABV4Y773_9CYAN
MKWYYVFPLTLFCYLLNGVPNIQAGTLGESLIAQESENENLLVNSRFPELKRGINLSEWFTNTNKFNPNHFTQEDLRSIKSLGFEHVRLPIAPEFLFDESNPAVLKTDYLSDLDRALDLIQANDLSVIIDLHPKNDFKEKLATDDTFVDSVTQFWGSLAKHLSSRNPEQVFLEVINEPSFNYFLQNDPTIDPVERWNVVQRKLVDAINKEAPNHTIILKGHDWGETINSLLELTPIKEETSTVDTTLEENSTPVEPGEETVAEINKPSEKYVYNFHFYDPMIFTHQGITWLDEELAFIKNLPYPFNEEVCAAAVGEIVDETAKIWAQDYCNQQWDAARLERRIAQAANWAQEHNVLLTANEFGVYRNFVRPEDRVAWLGDVRSLFEKYNIGWSMWDYFSPFGLVRENEFGDRILNENIATALGLTLPTIPSESESSTSPTVTPEAEIENSVTPEDQLSSLVISNKELESLLTPQEIPQPKRVPEPSAIAGFAVLTYMGKKLKRRA